MVVAFAPIVAFLLGVTESRCPGKTLVLSTVLYIVLPLIAGWWTRRRSCPGRRAAVSDFTARIKPCFDARAAAHRGAAVRLSGPGDPGAALLIALIAVPIIIQSYGIFALGYAWAWAWRLPHRVAAPCAMIGTSNFFDWRWRWPLACLA
jgi:ACR3 family arsenite transporter